MTPKHPAHAVARREACRRRALSIARSAPAIRCRAISIISGISASSLAPRSAIQIITGIVLAMHYRGERRRSPSIRSSSIMRDVNAGWFLRYAHATGASMFLHRRLYSHLSRPLLRIVQGAARDGVAARRGHLPPDDGDGVHGICPSLGTDELLGRAGDHRLLLGDPASSARSIRVWLLGGFAPGDADAQPLLLAPLSAALRDRRRVIVLHIWALHIPGSNNPDRRRCEGRTGYRSVSPLLHREGRLRARRLPADFRRASCSSRRIMLGHADNYIPANPLSTPGGDRARMVFPGHSTRSCKRLHRQLPPGSRRSCGA